MTTIENYIACADIESRLGIGRKFLEGMDIQYIPFADTRNRLYVRESELVQKCESKGIPSGKISYCTAARRMKNNIDTVFGDSAPEEWYIDKIHDGLECNIISSCHGMLSENIFENGFLPYFTLAIGIFQRNKDNETISEDRLLSMYPQFPISNIERDERNGTFKKQDICTYLRTTKFLPSQFRTANFDELNNIGRFIDQIQPSYLDQKIRVHNIEGRYGMKKSELESQRIDIFTELVDGVSYETVDSTRVEVALRNQSRDFSQITIGQAASDIFQKYMCFGFSVSSWNREKYKQIIQTAREKQILKTHHGRISKNILETYTSNMMPRLFVQEHFQGITAVSRPLLAGLLNTSNDTVNAIAHMGAFGQIDDGYVSMQSLIGFCKNYWNFGNGFEKIARSKRAKYSTYLLESIPL